MYDNISITDTVAKINTHGWVARQYGLSEYLGEAFRSLDTYAESA